ncbi:MAG: glycine oxidase ThiO [Rhodothermia bacterium]|nr:MAG: glycine oxidase ThiO [Rhodothermia bacterium]
MSIGWELIRSGHQVTIVERDRVGRGASWLAGGMLAANAEVGFEEMEFYRVSSESLRRWPEYARMLEKESSKPVYYREEGSISVADDRDSAAVLRRKFEFQVEHGLDVRWLSGAEALDMEPFLATGLSAAVHSPLDHQVDNRRVLDVLRHLVLEGGGRLEEESPVVAIVPDDKAPSIEIDGRDSISGEVVVLAAGAWSRLFKGIAPECLPAVRPVKGQILDLRVEEPFNLKHVVRGPHAYVVPKDETRVVIGATEEDVSFDEQVTAGGVYRLLEGAWEIVPGIYDLPLLDSFAGLRPGSRDNDPIVGWSDAPGVYYASGHYRSGVLLAPITAQEAALEIGVNNESDWLTGFRPQRFKMTASNW